MLLHASGGRLPDRWDACMSRVRTLEAGRELVILEAAVILLPSCRLGLTVSYKSCMAGLAGLRIPFAAVICNTAWE